MSANRVAIITGKRLYYYSLGTLNPTVLAIFYHSLRIQINLYKLNPKCTKMKKSYALKPFETIVYEITNNSTLYSNQDAMDAIIQKIANEKTAIYNVFQSQIFHLKNEDHIRVTVQQYYKAVVNLINRVYHLNINTLPNETNKSEVVSYILISLEELQHFFEVEYAQYLSPEEKVPLPELLMIKTDFLRRLPALPDILLKGRNTERSIEMVMGALSQFITRIANNDLITLREANYHVEFLKELERGETTILPDCPTLHEVLFVWNFNSYESLGYFTKEMQSRIDVHITQEEKLQYMRYEFKRMLHLPAKPKTIYDKRYPSIKSYFTGWLEKEIEYLEQKMTGVTPFVAAHQNPLSPPKPVKVMINLSVDQLGLGLKALTESKTLIANSLRSVFEEAAKVLCTPRTEQISWENMRTKSYTPEVKDVIRTIEAFENGIGILKALIRK